MITRIESCITRVQVNCARFLFIVSLLCISPFGYAAGTVLGGDLPVGSDASLDGLLPAQSQQAQPVTGNVSSYLATEGANSSVGLNASSAINRSTGLSQGGGSVVGQVTNNDSYTTESSTNTSNTYSQNSSTPIANTSSESYVLSAGDRISISVFDEPELSILDLTIPPDETINYPLIGQIALKGKTASQIQNELSSKLQQGYLVSPRVTVTVLQYRPFYIQGGVMVNGAMPYAPGLTVDKAVTLAGGLRDGVRLEDLKIGRNGAPYEAATSAQRSSLVNPGDVVYVPLGNEGANASYIYVYGEVNNPGRYQIYDSLTVEQAIILAGGLTDFASKRKVGITRNVDGKEVELKRVKLNELIQSNDVINVGAGLF